MQCQPISEKHTLQDEKSYSELVAKELAFVQRSFLIGLQKRIIANHMCNIEGLRLHM